MQQKSEYLNRKEAGQYLRNKYGRGTERTLAKLACQGGGPTFIKFSGKTLYRPDDLDAWFASKAVVKTSTSDAGNSLSQPR